jgi:hypothetical protein
VINIEEKNTGPQRVKIQTELKFHHVGFTILMSIWSLGGHLGIKQLESEADGTYPFGFYFMDVFHLCVPDPYTSW